jgi:Mg2+-importing ATPase
MGTDALVRAPAAAAWWLAPVDITAGARVNGLSSAEARTRLSRDGRNVFRVDAERSLVVQFIMRFSNPLVIILLLASAISTFTGEVANFLIISLINILSVTLDFVQEYRAGRAAEKLCLAVSVRTTVVRDGKSRDIPIADVVPGDWSGTVSVQPCGHGVAFPRSWPQQTGPHFH